MSRRTLQTVLALGAALALALNACATLPLGGGRAPDVRGYKSYDILYATDRAAPDDDERKKGLPYGKRRGPMSYGKATVTVPLAAAVRPPKLEYQRLVLPDQQTASLLSVEPTTPVFFLQRVRSIKGKPVIFLKNYVATSECSGIETYNFVENRLFELLENQFGLEIAWGRRYFEARVADAEVASALGIQPGDPVMFVKQIVYLEDGSPLEMSDIWINSANFRVSAIVRRGKSNRSLSVISGLPGYMQAELNV